MRWHQWTIIVLLCLNAGWMTFDGARALVVGDYVTPRSGPSAGQLGPWAKALQVVGLDPRSTLTKLLFVVYGMVTLAMVVAFALGVSWARSVLLGLAILGLWYLPIGTVLNLAVIIVLLAMR